MKFVSAAFVRALSALRTAAKICALAFTIAKASGAVVTVGPQTLTNFKGWGLMPAPYDREIPTYADGSKAYGDAGWLPPSGAWSDSTPCFVYTALKRLRFDIARVYVTPTIGNSDGTLNGERLQDLKDHLQSLKNMGVTKYLLNAWTPPAFMKSPEPVRYGEYHGKIETLNPDFSGDSGAGYPEFILKILKELTAAGFAAPVAISIQNEPDVKPQYDGCFYHTDSGVSLYLSVIKNLRSKLDANNYAGVPILAPETSGWVPEFYLGKPSASGFSTMNSDSTVGHAVGGFAFHDYFTSAHVANLRLAMKAYAGVDVWQTEMCGTLGFRSEELCNSGNNELDNAMNVFRRMAADFVDLRVNYWFFWRGWHSNNGPSAEDLLNDNSLYKTYYALQRLFTQVDPAENWQVKEITQDDPDLKADNEAVINSYDGNGNMMGLCLDTLAFTNAGGSKTVVALMNKTANSKTVTVKGLNGTSAQVWRSSPSEDMKPLGAFALSGGVFKEVALSPYSIVIIASSSGNTSPR